MTSPTKLKDNTSSVHIEDDLFYFESDHLAVRGNKDYSELLKTLYILSAQRERAIKDYEKVVEMKKEALSDPLRTVDNIKKGGLLVPPLQTVAEIPVINWYSYKTKIPEAELRSIYTDKQEKEREKTDEDLMDPKNTHKQAWTPEEQKKLEELLVEYPPEAIELRRIKKIAAALGNRTVKQVSSRLQKYFLKLYKAGLHVPGRIPKSADLHRKRRNKHKHNQSWKPTTFFPEYNVSVFMNDCDNAPGPGSGNKSTECMHPPTTTTNQNYLLPVGYPECEEPTTEKSASELQLELLKRIKTFKLKESESANQVLHRHHTYRCDYCSEEPIIGTRWHCSTCSGDSVDFCTDCILAQLYSDNCHPLTHTFITLPDPESASNISSDSECDSPEENSNVNYTSDTSDSDCEPNDRFNNTHFSYQNSKSNSSNGSSDDSMDNDKGKTGCGSSINRTKTLKQYKNSKNRNSSHADSSINFDLFNTQDVSYNYLHSHLSLNE